MTRPEIASKSNGTLLMDGLLTVPASLDDPADVAGIHEPGRIARRIRGARAVMIGRSLAIARLLERVRSVADTDAHVLVTGESGTGKELVARMLHEHSARKARPFVAANCAALPEGLLEAELFGHERGAFTGAVRRREGRFQSAHTGTIFLDEVAEIPLASQAKLLRVLQEGTFEPLGTNRTVAVDARVISATHRDLRAHIARGTFREDLYYRLNVIHLHVPALRERREDIPDLIEHFLRRFSPAGARLELTERAFAAVTGYSFPGNVREFEHAMQHATVLARGGKIDIDHLPPEIGAEPVTQADPGVAIRPLAEALREFERDYLSRALTLAGGRKARAADMLGISRKNLWEKLCRHGIGAKPDVA